MNWFKNFFFLIFKTVYQLIRPTYTSLFVVYRPYNSASQAVHFTGSLPYRNMVKGNVEEKEQMILPFVYLAMM